MPSRGKGKKKRSKPVSEMDFSAAENFIPPLDIDFNVGPGTSGGGFFDEKIANISQLKEPSETQKRLSKLIDERAGKFTYKDSTIADINRRTSRAVSGYKTKLGEFVYGDGKPVKANIQYHIHYISNLEEHYMTGVLHNDSSKLIFPLKLSQFSTYNNLNGQSPLGLKPKVLTPTKKDYTKGSIIRYFAKKSNEVMSPPFEITDKEFNKSPLYIYATIPWRISGDKGLVNLINAMSINEAKKSIPNIDKFLNPFQFYKGSTKMDKLNKEEILDRLGVVTTTQQTTAGSTTTSTSTTTTSPSTTTTQTQTGPPPGVTTGGAGGAY